MRQSLPYCLWSQRRFPGCSNPRPASRYSDDKVGYASIDPFPLKTFGTRANEMTRPNHRRARGQMAATCNNQIMREVVGECERRCGLNGRTRTNDGQMHGAMTRTDGGNMQQSNGNGRGLKDEDDRMQQYQMRLRWKARQHEIAEEEEGGNNNKNTKSAGRAGEGYCFKI